MNQPATSPPLRIQVVDSHTAGEPTRCVLSGLPDLNREQGRGPLSEKSHPGFFSRLMDWLGIF